MRFGLILGDQLDQQLATLKYLDPKHDVILMAEVLEETHYVAHHPQKIALIFSAMRHFAKILKAKGWRIRYHPFQPNSLIKSLFDFVESEQQRWFASQLIITHCGEYRLQHQIEQYWASQLQIPIQVLADDRFFCSITDFKNWAKNYKQFRLEYFYREMRKRTGYLMNRSEPLSGKWNFDSANRKAWKGEPSIHPSLDFELDQIDQEVIALVKREFPNHTGNLEYFRWATTRKNALKVLDDFIQYRLPYFGDYQDAMIQDQDFLFHSTLSPYLVLSH